MPCYIQIIDKNFSSVVGIIDSDGEGLINTDAPGGTGKTFLAEVILSYIRKSGDVAVACAMSGIAATLLSLGCWRSRGIASSRRML